MMDHHPTLPPASRRAIVLIALLQGLMLYAVQEAADNWPFNVFANRLAWYAWVLTVPTAITLTLVDLRDRRLWLHAGLATVLVLGMAGWIGWNLGGPTADLRKAMLLVPFTLSLGIAVFVALPWWQFRLHQGHWRATYAALFEHAWQNGLTLALAAAFSALTWMLLWLSAALFNLVGLDILKHLLGEKVVIALVTGMLAGFGVLIGRTQHRAIRTIRQVLFAVSRGLLPLLAFFAVIFVACLPFTGLDALLGTRMAASVMLVLMLLLVTFTNAVYQHESDQPAYPRPLRRLVEASLLTLPVYAALALYALALRISQYGWSQDRFWGLLVASLLAGYAVGYARAALRPRGHWLQQIEPVNRWMCWAVLAVAVLVNTPVLDPIRISLASQVARLEAKAPAITSDEATELRVNYGRRGVTALKSLQQAPAVMADPGARRVVADVLGGPPKQPPVRAHPNPIIVPITDLTVLQQHIKLGKGSRAPDADWWQAMLAETVWTNGCLHLYQSCVALRRDMDGDGVDDMLLCRQPKEGGAFCRLHARDGSVWTNAGKLYFDLDASERDDPQKNPLLLGHLEVRPSRWPLFSLGDGPFQPVDEPVAKEGQ